METTNALVNYEELISLFVHYNIILNKKENLMVTQEVIYLNLKQYKVRKRQTK